MSELMIDVDDALRAQQLKALWDKYGYWVAGVVVAAVLAVGAGGLWYRHLDARLTDQTNRLLTILQEESGNPDTIKSLATLDKEAEFPLKSVTGLYHAQKLEQGKDLAAAQNVYHDMISRKRLPRMVRDLARVHYVRLGLVQSQPAEKLLAAIQPATETNATFRASAMELKGLLLRQLGKKDEANKIFAALSTDSEVAGTLRRRAASLIQQDMTKEAVHAK